MASTNTALPGTVLVPGLDDRTSYFIKCFNFEKWGHYDFFPEPTEDNTPNKSVRNLAHIGKCLVQGLSDDAVNNNWILLDSCSTIICYKNDTIVSNITVRPLVEHLRVYRNRGHMDYTIKATLKIPL